MKGKEKKCAHENDFHCNKVENNVRRSSQHITQPTNKRVENEYDLLVLEASLMKMICHFR